jgi:hypothetical protein
MINYTEEELRKINSKMRNESILGAVIVVLAFVMMIMAIRLWG